jgi:hypothetical protein
MSETGLETELTAQEEGIHIPHSPATRLTDDHYDGLKKISRLPLTSFILTVLTFPIGLFNVNWISALNLIALCFAAITVLSTVILFLFVIRARKNQQRIVQKSVEVITPLLIQKYGIDVTEDLVVSLMSGTTLPLLVNGEVTRVALKNVDEETILMKG